MIVGAPTVDEVQQAAHLIGPHVRRTPLLQVEGGFLKLESLQATGSFKVRGFFAAALQASADERSRGLLTVSAGNAALACAYAARRLGVPCRVVMFETAPVAKRAGVERLGATVLPMSFEQLIDWMNGEGWTQEPELFIHPFADRRVMAGHGTLANELLEDMPNLGRVVVPVGGGGLITGIAATLKELRPSVEVVGVQSDGYPLWREAFKAGGTVSLKPATIADGTTGPFHPKMFELLKQHVDRWVVVPETEVRTAVAQLALDAKVVAEGAGALAFAALRGLEPGPETVAVVSGGNIDGSRLRDVFGDLEGSRG